MGLNVQREAVAAIGGLLAFLEGQARLRAGGAEGRFCVR